MKAKDVTIFYNPETYDCYTAVLKTGDVFGFNSDPYHPLGFGQYVGSCLDRLNVTFGYGWRNHLNEKKMLKQELKHYLSEAKSNPIWLGKEIQLSELSDNAQKYVHQLLED
jgi:hypothetical protein